MEPRPTRLSPPVVTAAADRILTEIRKQCADVSAFTAAKTLSQVVMALTASEDAFARALFLKDQGWPVDQRMVDLLHRRGGFEQAALDRAEMEWTTRTGVRFPCREGEFITIQVGHNFVTAKVLGVFCARSRALIQVAEKQPVPPDIFSATAEDVVKVLVDGVPRNPVIRQSGLFQEAAS
jgi:hypothetical protein